MTHSDTELTPPQRLALRYAPAEWRDELRALLLLDVRLGSVVQRGSEPLLTRIKLAWWREALEKNADARPKGEPLLAEISTLEAAGCRAIIASAIVLVDAWEEVADREAVDAEAVERHSAGRAEAVFGHFANRVGDRDALLLAGRIWAGAKPPEKGISLPRRGRAFSLLARASLVERQPRFGSALGYVWHALTGL